MIGRGCVFSEVAFAQTRRPIRSNGLRFEVLRNNQSRRTGFPIPTHRLNSRRTNSRVYVCLALLALTVALLRLRTYDEPVNRDLATYAVAAREYLGGRELYTDIWDLKPPAIFWTYALARRTTGEGPQMFYLMTVGTSVATLLGIYAAASAMYRRRGWIPGLYAAAAWTLVGGTLRLQANEPNTEPFINSCLVWAFALLLRLRPQHTWRRSLTLCLAVGLLLSWASLYKTVAVAHALAFGAALLVPDIWRRSARLRLTQLATIAAAATAPWLAVFGYYYATGAYHDFVQTVFGYNVFYAGLTGTNALGNILIGLHPALLLPKTMLSWLPLLGITLIGFALGRPLPRRLKWPALALLLYFVASHAATSMPGQFAPHYYQFWGPPLCIGGAWGLFLLQRRFRHARRSLAVATAAVLVAVEAPSYRLSAEESAIRKYGPDLVIERHLGEALNDTVLRPGETVYQWGSALPLIYAVKRPQPSGVFFISPLLGGPSTDSTTRRLIRDLDANRPDLVVKDIRDVPRLPQLPFDDYFQRNYTPLARDSYTGRFLLLARKGSPLEARRDQVIQQLNDAARRTGR